MKMNLNFEVITPTPLVFAFPAHRNDYNLQDGQLYHSSNFKRLEMPFLQKLKINKKLIEFMNKEEKLKALEVLDELLSDDGD